MPALWKAAALASLIVAGVYAHSASATVSQDNSTPRATQAPDPNAKPATDQAPNPPADSTKAEILRREKAIYPPEALEKRLQGQVWVKALISETGDVESVEVISGDRVLAGSAMDAAKKYKFKPFIRDGKPVRFYTKLSFNFAFPENNNQDKAPQAEECASGAQVPGTASTAGTSPGVASPQRVRVSREVSARLLLRTKEPVYPDLAQRAGIQGLVTLRATISKEGRIVDLQVISGPKLLAPAAIDAVQQWVDQPYELMGKPVEFETEIQVLFRPHP